MPKHIRFELTDQDGTQKVETDFSDQEWSLLEDYSAIFDQLATSPATTSVASFGFSIKWDSEAGWAPVDASQFPSRTDLAAFLHLFRPIILNDERTFFMKVLGVISQRAPSKAWKALKVEFDGRRFESMMTISMTSASTPEQPTSETLILNSGRTLQNWLNAFEYHRDAAKAAEFSEIHADDFPTPDHVKGLMLQLLVEKLKAAAKLRELIRALQQGPGASFKTK